MKGPDLTVIVVGSEKGGVGKTTLALALAHQAMSAGADVVVLDTDRQKSASRWAESRSMSPGVPALSVLAHSAAPLHEIASLARRYDLVVADIGAQNYRVLLECSMLADVYLIPSGTSSLDLDSAEELYLLLSRMAQGRHAGALRVVLNKVPPRENSAEVHRTRQRLRHAKVATLDNALAQRSVWRSFANTGLALSELPKRHADPRATQELQAVYDEVVSLARKGRKK